MCLLPTKLNRTPPAPPPPPAAEPAYAVLVTVVAAEDGDVLLVDNGKPVRKLTRRQAHSLIVRLAMALRDGA